MIFPISKLNEIINSSEGLVSVFGDFGVGKTIFALQTAIFNAKLGKNIIFLYSKPNFPSVKIEEILQDSPIETLDNISLIKITDFNEMISVILNIEFLILNNLKERNRNFNLLVIDSLTEVYRLELNREKKKKNVNLNYQLNQILGTLLYLLETYGMEILMVNELSRKKNNDEVIEVQKGGEIMNYWITNEIKIERTEILSERNLIVRKTKENEKFEVQTKITEHGFV